MAERVTDTPARLLFKRYILTEHVRVLSEDELDVLLRILGHDPATLRAPLPDASLADELEGGPG